MSSFLDRAKELRNAADIHYNCAQSVLLPFAEALGLDRETALGLAANFGQGMKRGSVCGAVTGGLMALGLYGVDDGAALAFQQRFAQNHSGEIDCKELLRIYMNGEVKPRKPHCDAVVYECVRLCEEILREKGKLS